MYQVPGQKWCEIDANVFNHYFQIFSLPTCARETDPNKSLTFEKVVNAEHFQL